MKIINHKEDHDKFTNPEERLKPENHTKSLKEFKSKYSKDNYSQLALNEQLLDACGKGDLEEVKRLISLISLGASIHTEKEEPLWFAAEQGHLAVVKHLVDNGANIHCHNDYALYAASSNGDLETVKFLIEAGANVNARDGKALYEAARSDHIEVVKFLWENGARMDKESLQSIIKAFGNSKAIDYLEQKIK